MRSSTEAPSIPLKRRIPLGTSGQMAAFAREDANAADAFASLGVCEATWTLRRTIRSAPLRTASSSKFGGRRLCPLRRIHCRDWRSQLQFPARGIILRLPPASFPGQTSILRDRDLLVSSPPRAATSRSACVPLMSPASAQAATSRTLYPATKRRLGSFAATEMTDNVSRE